MKVKEHPLSKEEQSKIKSKYWKNILANIIILLMLGYPFYLANTNRSSYGIPMILFNIMGGAFLLLLFLNLVGVIFSKKELNKDFEQKVKIKTQIKIKEKKELKRTDPDDFSKVTYRLIFEYNEYLTVYDVKQIDFEKVNVGDIIDLECSKYSKWVTKIEWNGRDIENKSFLS